MSSVLYIVFMPRNSVVDAQKTRNEILQTAIKNLTTDGYDKFSLRELAQHCNVTRGAVYNHFANKETLFLEIVRYLLEKMGGTIHRWAESGPSQDRDPMEALLTGTKGFLIESQAPEYQRIILLDAPAVLGMKRWQEIDDEYTTSTLVTVFSQLKKGTDSYEATVLAQAFSGAMNQLSRWISDDEDIQTAYSHLERMLRGFFRCA